MYARVPGRVASPCPKEEASASFWRARIPWYPAQVFGPYRSQGYSRRELLLDLVLHVVGLVAASVSAVFLVASLSSDLPDLVVVALRIYSLSLVIMFACSLSFHAFAWSLRGLWYLQLLDHAGILLLIAGSYTPFCAVACCPRALAFVWAVGGFSFVAKASNSRLDLVQVHVPCFLGMGWTLISVWDALRLALSPWARGVMLCGGSLYTAGLVPWSWSQIEGHNAIWHACVLAASACFYAVVKAEIADPNANWQGGAAAQCLA